MNRKKNAIRNIIWGLVNKIVMLLGPFLTRTVIIYYLGVNYLGLGSLFNSILSILNLTELGFSSAVIFSLYKPVAENNTNAICSLMNLYRKIYRAIGFIILFIGIIIMFFLEDMIKSDIPADVNLYTLYIIFLLNTVFSYWLFAYKNVLLIAHQRNDIASNINTIGFFVQYILQIWLLLSFHNYYAYIIVVLIFTIGRNIAISIIVDRKYPQYKCRGSVASNEKKAIKKRVLGLVVQKICSATRNTFDSIVLSSCVGLSIVGIYDNYYYIIAAAHKILDVILVSIRSGIGNAIAIEKVEKNYNDFCFLNYVYSWLSGICTVCLLCIIQCFIKIWVGEKYLFSDYIMVLFCIYFYSLTIIDIRSVYDDATGIWGEQKSIVIFEAMLNIFLNFLLGYMFGVAGVIIATILSIVVVNFFLKTRLLFNLYFVNESIFEYYREHLSFFFLIVIASFISMYICKIMPINGLMCLPVYSLIAFSVSNIIFIMFNFRNNNLKLAIKMLLNIK